MRRSQCRKRKNRALTLRRRPVIRSALPHPRLPFARLDAAARWVAPDSSLDAMRSIATARFASWLRTCATTATKRASSRSGPHTTSPLAARNRSGGRGMRVTGRRCQARCVRHECRVEATRPRACSFIALLSFHGIRLRSADLSAMSLDCGQNASAMSLDQTVSDVSGPYPHADP